MGIFVTKRDGSKEPLDIDKLHKVVFWATEGLTGVSASEVEVRSKLQFTDGIKTTDIQETLIQAAADLISEETPAYQYVAGRLITYHLRKQVYGRFQPTRLFDLIQKNVASKFYDAALLDYYTESEWDEIEDFVRHERDMNLTFAAMEQMRGKYLVQNRVTREILETPQVLYILVAATLFSQYPKETRLRYVKDYYDAISKHDISLPTPIMSGVRTAMRQYSSCTLIECDDSLRSINATSSAIVDYVSQRAGIGIGAGRIRALGSAVKGGTATHTGVTPFFKHFASGVNSCNQGGVRKGSATLYYPIWHLELEDMIVLKNNKGTEENRVRQLDYGVQFNKLFYERLMDEGDITLFSPNDVPEMYDAFFADYDRFVELYEAAEKNPSIRKKVLPAIEVFGSFMQQRMETGRIYLMNVDNANQHSSFDEKVAPVRMSNLCCEINLTTVPMGTIRTENYTIPAAALPKFMMERRAEEKQVAVLKARQGFPGFAEPTGPFDIAGPMSGIDGGNHKIEDVVDVEVTEDASRIALCTLSAVNWGNVKKPSDFGRICELAVRGLDALLDYQEYPVSAARLHTKEYRPLGVGIINLAYFLAKNGVRYSDGSALPIVDEYAEAWSYYLIKASVKLAKEQGACKLAKNTKYAKGIVPIDTRKLAVDDLVPHQERLDWEGLRAELREHGIRNSTLMALMPAETSAQIANATNGIEPPRALVSKKVSKHGVMAQVVPEIKKLKKKYELLWDQQSPVGYLHICAVLQKYIDQGISVNTSYNPALYEGNQVPLTELLDHLIEFYQFGGKQLYYCNTNDGQGEVDVDKYLGSDASSVTFAAEEESCDSCTI